MTWRKNSDLKGKHLLFRDAKQIKKSDKRIKDLEKRIKALQGVITEISRHESFDIQSAREYYPALKKITDDNGDFCDFSPNSTTDEDESMDMSPNRCYIYVNSQSSDVCDDSIESNSDTIECISSDPIEFSSDSSEKEDILPGSA